MRDKWSGNPPGVSGSAVRALPLHAESTEGTAAGPVSQPHLTDSAGILEGARPFLRLLAEIDTWIDRNEREMAAMSGSPGGGQTSGTDQEALACRGQRRRTPINRSAGPADEWP